MTPFDDHNDTQELSDPDEMTTKKDALLKIAQDINLTNLSEIQGKRLTTQALSIAILQKIPFFTGFLRSVDGTGLAVSKLAALKGGTSAPPAAHGFQIGGLVLSAIDFIRIPLIYGASWLLGIKSPITLSKGARWLYSSVVLALAIIAFALPVAAPIIGLVSAIMGLSVAVFTLGKHFFDQHQKKKNLAIVQAQIEEEMMTLESIQLESTNLIKDPENLTPTQLENTEMRLIDLNEQFTQKKQKLQSLRDTEVHLQQKLEKLGGRAVLNKGLAMGLASLALVGVVVAMFFPPVGLSLIVASAAIGGLYFLGSVAVGFLSKVFKSDNHAKKPETFEREQENEPLLEEKNGTDLLVDSTLESTSQLEHSSVFNISEILGGKDQTSFLKKEVEQMVFLQKVVENVATIVEAHDSDKIVQFFKQMALYTKENHMTLGDMQFFMEDETMQSAINLFKHMPEENKLTEADNDILQCYKPFATFLEKQGVILPQPEPCMSGHEKTIELSNPATAVSEDNQHSSHT